MRLLPVAFFLFFKIIFFNKKIRNTIRVSNALDPNKDWHNADQDWHSVNADLGPKLFAKLISRRKKYI